MAKGDASHGLLKIQEWRSSLGHPWPHPLAPWVTIPYRDQTLGANGWLGGGCIVESYVIY